MILEYKGIPVFYTDSGKGNSIVFLHGFLENSSMWHPFVSLLSQKNRIICIDLLGHGKTGCLGYIHTMELMGEVVEAVLNYLNISKSILIGHSMGGYVALAFAEKNPDAVSGLCLMNSTTLADTPEKQVNRDRAIVAVKQNHKTFIRMAVANLFRPKNRINFSDKINVVINEALETPVQGIVAALEGMKIRKNREFLLHTTTFKKMMVIGKKDPALDYQSLIEQLKNADIIKVEFPDGHMSHIENESELLHNLMHFVEN
jgi:pimeloyl-ACP methyl ester carboxylesterase